MQAGVEQAVNPQVTHAEVTVICMPIWNSDNESSGSGCGLSSRFAVLQHKHLGWVDTQTACCQFVDFRMRLSVGDIFGSQRELKMLFKLQLLQQPLQVGSR